MCEGQNDGEQRWMPFSVGQRVRKMDEERERPYGRVGWNRGETEGGAKMRLKRGGNTQDRK